MAVGRYLLSTLVRPLDDGGFTAGVSIRSGQGSACTDRVIRFKGSFPSEPAAHRYAHAQGLQWVSQMGRVVS